MGCLLAEPVVDRLEQELAGSLVVLQVNIFSPAGEDLTARYGSRGTPTFVFLDGEGEEVWRSIGAIDPDRVRASIP